MQRRYRVIIAKPGLDGHDRGARIVALGLRDAGFEVVYLGLFQTPEAIVSAALQEGADAIGLSVLSGAHLPLFGEVIDRLRNAGGSNILLFGGGIIPVDDVKALKELGVAEVFTPGTPLPTISEWLELTLDKNEVQSHG